MKKITTIMVICGLASSAFPQNFGIGVTNPAEKLDVDGNIHLQNVTTGRRDVRGTMGDNDFWSIGANATGSNAGVLEIATGDDGQSATGAEPIVVRQYGPGTPWTGTLVRTAYLLDGSGNTSFPGNLAVSGATTISGGLAVSGTVISQYGGNARINANADNAAGGGISISDDGGFYDYNDGFVTFNGSTGVRIAGNNGPGSGPGDLRFGCRSGFWAVADGRICMETTLRGPQNMHDAIGTCRGLGPGCRVCEHNDFQQACGVVGNPYGSSNGWYGDHGVAPGGNWDDEFGTWNGNGCANNNDGPADNATSSSRNYRCCY